jgi:hypothetical protein
LRFAVQNSKSCWVSKAALDKANPSHATGDSGKAVKFYFLKNQSFEPSAKGVAAFEPDVHGNPAVIVDPNSLDKTPITERDRDTKRDGPHRSIESVMIHELGHHSEEKVFKNPAEKADFYKGMGMVACSRLKARRKSMDDERSRWSRVCARRPHAPLKLAENR